MLRKRIYDYIAPFFWCVSLLAVVHSAHAQYKNQQITYYVYADSIAFYDKPDVKAKPTGYYYFKTTLTGFKPTGLFVNLPMVDAGLFDPEYLGENSDLLLNDYSGEWLEKTIDGSSIYISRHGLSTFTMPIFDSEMQYTMAEMVKNWLTTLAGKPIDSVHSFLPKDSIDDTHEEYQISYAKGYELSVEDDYFAEGVGGSEINMYLPLSDVSLIDGYWLAIRLFLGEEYGTTIWSTIYIKEDSIRIARYSEGQTLEISVVKEKDGMRFLWFYGGC